MIEILFQLSPIFLYFGLGIALKAAGVANKSNGEFVLHQVSEKKNVTTVMQGEIS